MRTVMMTLLVAAALAAAPAFAADLRISSSDSFETLLAAQKNKRVTVRTRSGQELTGVVRDVTPRFVQLGALTGRDFFDAVIAFDAIEALIVRTKE